ncbi:MAG TPA: hypothetical protein VE377_15320 [Candidatus Dormibacteraeota bacterium]|nr:hypothetical protein [Candidatus Dormibacteraeota bacterium]
MGSSLDALLNDLEAARNSFGRGAASRVNGLLRQLSRQEFDDPKSLIRFHEALLFLRAFPASASVVPQVEKLLHRFHERIGRIRQLGGDMSVFDDFDTSGIAGTTMQDTLNFEVARWLVRRIPGNVEIAWDDYDEERAMGSTWPRFVPLLEEDSDVEANIPWRRWLDAARGREKDFAWLIRRFEEWDTSDLRLKAELYDSMRLPLRWHLKNLKLSRTRNWRRPGKFFVHDGPLITRRDVSLAREFERPAPKFVRLSRREGEAVMQTIREVMVVRYRELYGTTLGDPTSVVRAEAGRGVVFYFWNLPPSRRLPVRAYVAGFTLKNGVPINYVEAIGLCEWIEVGFNTFYTYRQGETAWIYAQALRCLCAWTGAKTISVYPYQIGQNNDEALDSGAFWFYRKLGFRSGKPELEQLARNEERKIAADAKYRTPRRTLARLAEAHVFYEVPGLKPRFSEGTLTRPLKGRSSTVDHAFTVEPASLPEREALLPALPAEIKRGPWDTFSTRNLALRVNQRMAREFGGDAVRIREASMREVARAVAVNPSRWTPSERHSFANWSLVLALIPGLAGWTGAEKRQLVAIIRAQSGRDEMHYLRRTQQHERLRNEFLRLGSK